MNNPQEMPAMIYFSTNLISSLKWILLSTLQGNGSRWLKEVFTSSKNKQIIKSSYDKKARLSTAIADPKAMIGIQHLSPLDFAYFSSQSFSCSYCLVGDLDLQCCWAQTIDCLTLFRLWLIIHWGSTKKYPSKFRHNSSCSHYAAETLVLQDNQG